MGFKTIINKLSSITDEAWRDLTELFEEFTLNKNEYLITEGQKAHHCYFLKEGVIRVFYTHEGNEYNKKKFGLYGATLLMLVANLIFGFILIHIFRAIIKVIQIIF